MEELRKLKNFKNLTEDQIVKLPNKEVGKVVEITDEGVYVLNFNEKERIRKKAYTKKKCNYCNKMSFMKDLFKEEFGRKYKCRICIDGEIREESIKDNQRGFKT